MTPSASKYRHVVQLQRSMQTQDSAGQMSTEYVTFATVRASVEPLSGREFVAAQQVQAETSTRIAVRFRPDLDSTIRILHEVEPGSPPGIDVYDVTAALPDPVTGRRWVTFMAIKRVAEGWRRGESA